MTRVLVTGASGVVGRALVPALVAAGYAVRAAVRRLPARFDPVVEAAPHGDFDDAVDWRPLLAGIDAVVHLAGIAHTGSGAAQAQYDRVNHCATADLAAASAAAGIKHLVFMSSIRAQSGPSAVGILTEADVPRPTDPYGRSKLAAEIAVAKSGIPFTVLRPVLVYGPGVKGNLRTLIRLAALPVPLPFGALTNRRSLVGIGNLVGAIIHVLGHAASPGETYLVADPRPVAVAEIVAALRTGMGRKPWLVAVPPGLIGLGLAMGGRGRDFAQIAGALVANPCKLMASGWHPDGDTLAGLAAMAHVAVEA
jgi:nucleoside-diphosphate-sugar epimerase